MDARRLAAIAPGRAPAAGRRLAGALAAHRIASARVAWAALVLLAVGYGAVRLPERFADQLALRGPTATTSVEALRASLDNLGWSAAAFAGVQLALTLVVTAVCLATGLLLAWRRPADRAALPVTLLLLTLPFAEYPPLLQAMAAERPLLATVGKLLTFVAIGSLLCLLPFLFPDGRFVPRWTVAAAAAGLALHLGGLFLPGSPLDSWGWPPLAREGGSLLLVGVALGAQVHRYRRVSGSVERQQAKWAVVGLAAALTGFVALDAALQRGLLPAALPAAAAELALAGGMALAFLCVPISLAVAVHRRGLWAIDHVLHRALVWGGLTAAVAGLYAAVVAGLGALLQTGDGPLPALAAAGLVAVLFAPLHDRLRRGVSRLLYGARDEPYAALARLGRRLEETPAPASVLAAIVEAVAGALKLPYAAIALRQGDGLTVVAATGVPTADLLRLPLAYGAEPVGELLVAPRAPGEAFGPADRRLLADLARQAGAAAHAARLTADLQRSRERLVTASEDERRRLRRDLHDGLGPRLAALTLRLEAARDREDADPATAATLDDLAERAREAVADIRRLVYALRPPALDELGLTGALRQAAAGYEGAAGPRVAVEAPAALPPLPAAVEVAAYRIAQEALANAMRHAGAHTCLVRLAPDAAAGVLRVEVRDDGRGIPADRATGVGMQSMRERAEELGGRLAIEARPGGGAVVRAELPFRPPAGAGEPAAGGA